MKVKPPALKLGDRVVIANNHTGLIRWIGQLDSEYVNTEYLVGIQLDNPGKIYGGNSVVHLFFMHGIQWNARLLIGMLYRV